MTGLSGSKAAVGLLFCHGLGFEGRTNRVVRIFPGEQGWPLHVDRRDFGGVDREGSPRPLAVVEFLHQLCPDRIAMDITFVRGHLLVGRHFVIAGAMLNDRATRTLHALVTFVGRAQPGAGANLDFVQPGRDGKFLRRIVRRQTRS